jgi:hypothetical protein
MFAIPFYGDKINFFQKKQIKAKATDISIAFAFITFCLASPLRGSQ